MILLNHSTQYLTTAWYEVTNIGTSSAPVSLISNGSLRGTGYLVRGGNVVVGARTPQTEVGSRGRWCQKHTRGESRKTDRIRLICSPPFF